MCPLFLIVVGPHPHDLYLATFGRSTMFAPMICLVASLRTHEPTNPTNPTNPPNPYQLNRMTICPLRGGPNTVPVLMRP